jgi:hypothetical protein
VGLGFIAIRHCHERISRCRLVCDINLCAVATSLTGRRTLVEVGMQVASDLVQCLHRPPVLRLLLGYLGDGSLAVFSIASRSVACNLSVQLVVRERILVRNFIADCHRIAPDKNPLIQNPPYDCKQPPSLRECDDRFNKFKRKRIYACDTCHNIVAYSPWTRISCTYAQGEFQGSYVDSSWARSIPTELLERAYTEKLIDCTWHCSQFCQAAPTGVKDRISRPMLWRDRQHGS